MNNYQKQVNQIQQLKGKPSLLLHVCCGVCSVFPLIYLRKYFKLTIYFSNSNIYPYEEYQKRLNALYNYLHILNDDNITIIEDKYDNDNWIKQFQSYSQEKEGSIRCKLCYESRMRRAFEYAFKHHYDYCTTIMSISNRKNADWINEIGEQLQKQYPQVIFLHTDFKKNDGITKNEKMNKQLNLYHQCYCGCIYSLKALQD